MQIVVLDYPESCAETINWEAFADLGHLTRYPETTLPDLLSRSETADVLITRRLPLRREVLDYLTHVRAVVVPAETSAQLVEMEIARQLGVAVLSVPDPDRSDGADPCDWWNHAAGILRTALRQ